MRIPNALVVLVAALTLGACTAAPRVPYEAAESRKATVPGFETVRTWADDPSPAFTAAIFAARRLAATRGRPATYLSLSGGGGDGAYGAGVLNGWTETGTRPSFSIVSGVSTGALIAPFAFLGPDYDPVIRDLYTSGVAETLLDTPDPISAVFGTSLFSNDNLRELAARYVTPEVVAAVARERAQGRLLLVVTTNLDAQRAVLWDLGAIAREGTPAAVQLFRDVLVASASIPAVFPPIFVGVEADGRAFSEMHVDGTITSGVFTLPRRTLDNRDVPRALGRLDLYVIVNAKLQPDFAVVSNRAAQIGTRTFSTFVGEQTRNDIARTEEVARRAGFGFRVTAIDPDVKLATDAGFETAYMQRLFALGHEKPRTGRLWQRTLPPPETVASR